MNFFDEWFENNFADNEVSINVKWLMRNSFKAGWDACRDRWGGFTYEGTREIDHEL